MGQIPIPLPLPFPCLFHPCLNSCRRFTFTSVSQLVMIHSLYIELNIKAIQHGAADTLLIATDSPLATSADSRGIPVIAAWTWVGCCHKDDIYQKTDITTRPPHRYH